jgi:hypothetical protein
MLSGRENRLPRVDCPHAADHLSRIPVRLARGRVGRGPTDIDIGIEGPAAVPNPALAAIQDELDEAPTLYTIDVVDFTRVPDKFRKLAR